jgi:hypothetical protein
MQAVGVILLDLTTLAGIFVYSRREQLKKRADKLKPFKAATGQAPPAPSN